MVHLSDSGLTLMSQGQTIVLTYQGQDFEPFSANQVLRKGDKLAVSVEPNSRRAEKILLLSPCLGEPLSPTQSWDVARRWPQFLGSVATYFESNGFCRLFTPSLVVGTGMEPHLEPFATEFKLGRRRMRLFMPTSPELSLKKLLAAGWSEIFEIAPAFRNGEVTDRHQPQFTMLEWYRAYSGLDRIENDVLGLLRHLEAAGWVSGSVGEPERWTVKSLIQHVTGTALEFKDNPEWNDEFHQLWVSEIDPWLEKNENPILVTEFPVSQAALARVRGDVAERSELYWRGLELSNGYHELNDPEAQRGRFVRDRELRQKLGRVDVGIDEEFMKALQSGLPPSGGMALGLERLFMACQRIAKIDEVVSFPIRTGSPT